MTPTEPIVPISGAFLKTWFHLNNVLRILLVIMGAAVKEGLHSTLFTHCIPWEGPAPLTHSAKFMFFVLVSYFLQLQ